MRKELRKVLSFVKEAGYIKGRKRFQKMVFILQQKGVKFHEYFRYHFYGPYSADLQLEIDALVDWGFLTETKHGDSCEYKISEESAIEDFEDIKKNADLIHSLNKLNPQILEVVATFYYLKNKDYKDFQDIQQKTLQLKPHLEKEIENAGKIFQSLG